MNQEFTPFSLAFAYARFRRDIRRSLDNGNAGFGAPTAITIAATGVAPDPTTRGLAPDR
jgi:hypothetical protein